MPQSSPLNAINDACNDLYSLTCLANRLKSGPLRANEIALMTSISDHAEEIMVRLARAARTIEQTAQPQPSARTYSTLDDLVREYSGFDAVGLTELPR